MRIVCPSCAAEYEVPAERLRPRRIVRCARCGGEWMAMRDAEPAARPSDPWPISAPEPEPEAPAASAVTSAVSALDRLAAPLPAARGSSRVGLTVAWILSFSVVAGAAAASVVFRDDIIRVWPPSARILG